MSARYALLLRSLATLGVLLVVANLVTAYRYAEARRLARLTERDGLDCDRRIAVIEKLSALAPTEDPDDDEQVVARLRAGLAEAGIDDTTVVDIRISPPIAVPRTSFMREDASLTLRGVAPQALLAFVHQAESRTNGVICSAIEVRLPVRSSPGRDADLAAIRAVSTVSPVTEAKAEIEAPESGDRAWNVQVTLTRLRRGGKSLRRVSEETSPR